MNRRRFLKHLGIGAGALLVAPKILAAEQKSPHLILSGNGWRTVDGSLSPPILSFKNDLNTGIYRSGGDITITWSGSSILRLT